jgi:hypothetical protein
MNIKNYDIVIIGSGIAGLYAAYQIQKKSPNTSFVVLEKYKKQWIGGRTSNDTFYGTQIVTGAGVGREDTNPLLIDLLKDLNIPYEESLSVMNYSKMIRSPVDVQKIIEYLRKKYIKHPELRTLTFKEFAENILGVELYHKFIISAGYTDCENADIKETLYNYGMDDNKGGWTMLFIPWKKLVLKLWEVIGLKNIRFSQNVDKIIKKGAFFDVLCENSSNIYHCKKVIIATTISSIQKLIKDPLSIYKQIHGQPFLRLYGKFDKKSAEIMKMWVPNYTIVPGPLQKIIPIDADKGVYMIAYSDNRNALFLKKYLSNTFENRKYLAKLIEKSLGIPENSLYLIAIKDFYWPIGTHYYGPLKGFRSREDFVYRVQHPMKNMLVVGEAVSRYQGWVEGALESVETVLTKKWIEDD